MGEINRISGTAPSEANNLDNATAAWFRDVSQGDLEPTDWN